MSLKFRVHPLFLVIRLKLFLIHYYSCLVNLFFDIEK